MKEFGGPCDYLGGHWYLILGHNEVSSVCNDFLKNTYASKNYYKPVNCGKNIQNKPWPPAPLGGPQTLPTSKILMDYYSSGKVVHEKCFIFDRSNLESVTILAQTPPKNDHFFRDMQTGRLLPYIHIWLCLSQESFILDPSE